MATALAWAGLVAGLVGVVNAISVVVGGRGGGGAGPPVVSFPFCGRLRPLLKALVAVVVVPSALAILLREPPFAAGGDLGWGCLLGGGFALALACLGALAVGPPGEPGLPGGSNPARQWMTGTALAIGQSGWSLAGITATYLIFDAIRQSPSVALMGHALGFTAVALLVRAAGDGANLGLGENARWRFMEPQAVLVAGLAAASWLAAEHFTGDTPRWWWSLPFALAALGLLAAIAASWPASLGARLREGPRLFVGALVGAVIVAILSLLLATKLLHSWPMFACAGLGLAAAGLVTWLIAAAGEGEEPARALQAAAFAGVILLGLIAACFRLMGGYGVALGLCAGWAVLLPALGGLSLPRAAEGTCWQSWGARLTPFLSAWVLALLYRVFMDRYRAGAYEAAIHYSFVAAGLGMLVMLLFVGYGLGTLGRVAEAGARGARLALCRASFLGLAAVVVPLVLGLAWGKHAGVGLMAGLVMGALVLAAWRGPTLGAEELPPGTLLAGLGAALVAVQLTHLLEPLLAASRTMKLLLVLGVLAVALAWVVVDALRRKEAGTGPIPAQPPESEGVE